jgi:hypothetical protein
MRKSQLLSIIARIRGGATSPQNIFDSLNALATNPPYGGTAITTTLPTVLAQGEQIIYRDANGVQSLWIGNADGEAWPAVGYKEYVAMLTQNGTDAPVATSIMKNDIGITSWTRQDIGIYQSLFDTSGTGGAGNAWCDNDGTLTPTRLLFEFDPKRISLYNGTQADENNFQVFIRIYP